ncbi:hypothetical protein OOK29_25815 [Streptomyces phaeochromogenes]|uniref:hypothetical protein n=1 Tax=Streptomyces phaeochromogenes TaxID=1923 RepID=UPI00225841C6|nr:hypothetical protein [Streptomyces phaeochromogenes]MCX5601571.1 hypothetical protein [Streptomyces phaeochromogenes]
MARGHGRILTAIWEDRDFLALTTEQQRMYLFLISQPNLDHAGVLPLTLKRWSRKAAGLTVTDVEKVLTELAERGFVVIDDDTEELLIRTFVRNDGVWKQPKVMASMVSSAEEISSHALRRVLLTETARLPLTELNSTPGPSGLSVRQQIETHLVALRRSIAVPQSEGSPPLTEALPNPSAPLPEASPKGSSSPSASLPDTPGDPLEKGSESLPGGLEKPSETPGEGTTRAHAPASRAHSPAPAPAPYPDPTLHVGDSADEQAGGAGAAEPPGPTIEDDEATETDEAAEAEDDVPQEPREDVELVCTALADAIADNGSKRPAITKRWRTEARLLLDRDGKTVDQVLKAIAWCQSDEFWKTNILSMPKLRSQYDRLALVAQRQQSQRPAAAGSYGFDPTSGTDLFDRALLRSQSRTQPEEL